MKPEKIFPIDTKKFVYAICKCPVTTEYGIKMPKIKGKDVYPFECSVCGCKGEVIIGNAAKAVE